MLSRVTSFGQYNFLDGKNTVDADIPPAVSALFKTVSFVNVAKEICPPDKQILDPFQFNFIINLPGLI